AKSAETPNEAEFAAALAGITFRNTSEAPDSTDRTIDFKVKDASGATSQSATAVVKVIPVNDPPTISVTDQSPAFTEMAGSDTKAHAVVINSSVAITDVDLTDPKSATVTITNLKNGDELLFTDTTEIHGSYNAGTGVLTLTAQSGRTPTEAQFEAALSGVKFNNTSDTPDTTARVIEFKVTDQSDVTSTAAVETVSVTPVNEPAVIAGTDTGSVK
ncbi:MAG: sulfurtransferase, partial [Pseudomonadota bacterium]